MNNHMGQSYTREENVPPEDNTDIEDNTDSDISSDTSSLSGDDNNTVNNNHVDSNNTDNGNNVDNSNSADNHINGNLHGTSPIQVNYAISVVATVNVNNDKDNNEQPDVQPEPSKPSGSAGANCQSQGAVPKQHIGPAKLHVEDDYKASPMGYFIDYISNNTIDAANNIMMAVTALSANIFDLIGLMIEYPLDIDKRLSIGANITCSIFILCLLINTQIAQCLPTTANIMDRRNRLEMIEDLARSNMVLLQIVHQQGVQPWKSLQEDQVLHKTILTLCQQVLDTTQAGSIHLLALRYIEQNGETCPLLQERAANIREQPIMEYELRTNSVFPMLYTLKKRPIPLLASLLDNANVRYHTHYLMIEDTANNIIEYMKYLKIRRYFSTATLTTALSRVLEHRHNTINIRNPMSLYWPLRALFYRVDYSTAFNTRFPNKRSLPERSEGRCHHMKVPGIRTNFFNELEMKKSYFEEILRSNKLVEHWNIWSNDDAQEYLRKRSETATSTHSDDTPMEISRTSPRAPAEEPAAPPEEEEQTPVMQQNYDVD
jgi:hypothetical protein